ncbi:MAG: hypothetical protein HKN13_10680, partial [Rhodothermales bacterium]|nr:hypothetical protein [Rhodothermales bacterium]
MHVFDRALVILPPAALAVVAALLLVSCSGDVGDRGGPSAGMTLPDGFTATLFAEGLVTPRHIAVNANGDVYVAIRAGQSKFVASDEPGAITALRDNGGDGVADEAV